jgi:hypothetical protein
MTKVAPMSRSFLRRAAVVLASGALICFCSCERHYPSELEEGENAQTGIAHHEPHGKGDAKRHEKKADEHGDTQSRATTAMSVTPPPASPGPTTANFFPTASPH